MEDTLRDEEFQDWILDALVLILVLMEDTLRDDSGTELDPILDVLILVLMEDTLRAMNNFSVTGYIWS